MQDNETKLLDGTLSRSKKKYEFDPVTGRYTKRPDANPRGPDYYGTFKLAIPGVQEPFKIYVNAWLRKGTDGSAFLSVSGEPDRDEHRTLAFGGIAMPKQAQPSGQRPATIPPQDDEDPLPF